MRESFTPSSVGSRATSHSAGGLLQSTHDGHGVPTGRGPVGWRTNGHRTLPDHVGRGPGSRRRVLAFPVGQQPQRGSFRADLSRRCETRRWYEVDVPADPQPHARAGARRHPRGRGPAVRVRHLRPRLETDRRAARHRHGVPEAEPRPGDVHPRQRPRGTEAHGHQGAPRRPRRPRRGVPDEGRPVERGPRPPPATRRSAVRRPAATALHRPVTGRAPAGAADGRAGLGPRPRTADYVHGRFG